MKYCIMLLRCEVVNLKEGLTFSACVCVCFMLVILTICSLRNRTCFTFFRSILSQFSESQMSRYESFRRSGFQKANMKRVCSIFLSLRQIHVRVCTFIFAKANRNCWIEWVAKVAMYLFSCFFVV